MQMQSAGKIAHTAAGVNLKRTDCPLGGFAILGRLLHFDRQDKRHDSRSFEQLAMPRGVATAVGNLMLFACCILFDGSHIKAQAADTTQRAVASQAVPRITAGTHVGDADAKRWNRVVLLARPRIASGDVSSLSSSIKNSVTTFVLTILATVESYEDARSGEGRYRLREVGVGYSTEVEGTLRAVSLASASNMGLSLGFIQRQMLSENEKQLGKVRLIMHTSTLAIFDAPAILLRDGRHQDFVVRHFVWINSKTGDNAAMVWLLKRSAGGELGVVDEPIRHLPAGFKEDRTIHIDGDEFTLGIPSERAFALEQLPPGKPLGWGDDGRMIAALDSYSMDQVGELSMALNAALNRAKAQQ